MAKKAKANAKSPAAKVGDAAEVVVAGKAPVTALVIPTIKASALSKDVGPAVIASLYAVQADEEKANQLLAGAKTKRYDVQSQLTLAIVKAAKADNSIDLSVAFNDDAKMQAHLNNQIGLALGFREVYTVGAGAKAKQTISYAKAVNKFFPAPGDDKDHPETKRKMTLRSNFLHRLKQCVMVASGIVEKDMKAEMDKETGTLRLTGPAVKSQFGAPSVLLNEQQTVKDAKGKETKLTEKPSYTAIAAKAAEAHGKAPANRGSGGDRTIGTAMKADPEKAIQTLCAGLVQAVQKMAGKLTDPMRQSLESVQNALDKVL